MGLLSQKIRLVIHLGYAGHKGGESLQAGKEKLIAGQKVKLEALVKGEALLLRTEIQSPSKSRNSRHSPGTGELHQGCGGICLKSIDTSVR